MPGSPIDVLMIAMRRRRPSGVVAPGHGSPFPLYSIMRRRRIPPTPLPATFLAALVAYLRSVPALSPLTAIYLDQTPPGSTVTVASGWRVPFLIYNPDAEPAIQSGASSYRTRQKITFSTFAAGPDGDISAEQLGRLVYSALMPNDSGGLILRPAIVSTDAMELIAKTTDATTPQRHPALIQGKPLWFSVCTCEFLLKRNR